MRQSSQPHATRLPFTGRAVSGVRAFEISVNIFLIILSLLLIKNKKFTMKLFSPFWLVFGFLATMAFPAFAAPHSASFSSAITVPFSGTSFAGSGHTISFTLGFAPAVGTQFTVVNNTGPAFTSTFDNLAHGQTVMLTYSGSTYYFVADYYGGTGNDLVLHWKKNRPVAWGLNSDGQLGDGTNTNRSRPVPVDTSGVLAGKTIVQVSPGYHHAMALCSDGTVVTWGNNYSGELGNNSTTNSSVPVLVDTSISSALYGKRVVGISAGESYSLALCSDGTIAGWGANYGKVLGSSLPTWESALIPIHTVSGVGALQGKTVTHVAAGGYHGIALCSDGTLATWGNNYHGQLGNNTTTDSAVPVAVNTTSGVSSLHGKTVSAIDGGMGHTLVLCTDGSVSVWGINQQYQVNEDPSWTWLVPFAVDTSSSSALFGKTVIKIKAAGYHSYALCSDNTLVAWGYNYHGQLGDGTADFPYAKGIPVAVSLSSVTVLDIFAGLMYGGVVTDTGTAQAWGDDGEGALGDNEPNADQYSPVSVDMGLLAGTERFVPSTIHGFGYYYGLGVVADTASPSPYIVVEQPASTGLTDGQTSIHFGALNISSSSGNKTFTIRNTGTISLTGLAVTKTGSNSADFTVGSLGAATLAAGASTTFTVSFTPSAAGQRHAELRIASNMEGNENPFNIPLTGAGLGNLSFTYNSAADVAITAGAISIPSATASFSLGYAPAIGTELTVINNTGITPISGTFSNLPHGQVVTLTYGGTPYLFVANYYGRDGNDLVLAWHGQKPYAWGSNSVGQFGDGGTTSSNVPVATNAVGVLTDKTVLKVTMGETYSLALASDGTMSAWGSNTYGELGDNTFVARTSPVAVYQAGVLSGKTVVSIASGFYHNLALCSDGTLASWGYNAYGSLGDDSVTTRKIPVLVNKASGSALQGKTVAKIFAGTYHSLALCTDGTLVSWGSNVYGELGDGTTTSRDQAVLVNTSTALLGKTVVDVVAGYLYTVALCSDGTVAAWGLNSSGQLGNNSNTNASTPQAVNTTAGVSALALKNVVRIAAGFSHTLALCSDGTVVAWGLNGHGAFGDNSVNSSWVPVPVSTASGVSVLHGKTVTSIAGGQYYSVARCSDGTLASWGYNYYSTLGDGTAAANRLAPVAVSTSTLSGDQVFTQVNTQAGNHALALVASGQPGIAVEESATTLTDGSSTVNFGTVFYAASTTVAPAVKTFTIRNIGTGELNSLSVTKAGAASANYTVSPLSSTTVPPGGTATFTVSFVPSATGARAATLDVISNVTGSANPFDISLTGTGSSTAVVANYYDGSEIPVTAATFTASSKTFTGNLGYAPLPGTDLTVVSNTGTAVISGTFTSLPQWSTVTLTYNSVNYNFTINYFGGDGNDIVLISTDRRLFAWGQNNYGQRGDTDTSSLQRLPLPLPDLGVLAGKSIVSVATGSQHSVALCSDGFVAAWGRNTNGEVGDGTTTQRNIPVAVSTGVGSALYSKTVVAIACGGNRTLALCSDNTLVAWGQNWLGNSGGGSSSIPVAVQRTSPSALSTAEKIAQISIGLNHCLVRCLDGSLYAWGDNSTGAVGDNSTTNRSFPVAVNITNGVSSLYGKTPRSIDTGENSCLVLDSVGNLHGWGDNSSGQLTDGTSSTWTVPIAMDKTNGLSDLYGRSVVSASMGRAHVLALCSDGSLVSWGSNGFGELGRGVVIGYNLPAFVSTASGTSALYGRTVARIFAGTHSNVVLCTDGTLVGWGNYVCSTVNILSSYQQHPTLGDITALSENDGFVGFSTGSAGHVFAISAGASTPGIVVSYLTSAPGISPRGFLSPNENVADLDLGADTSFTVTNTGVTNLTGISISLGGATPAAFTLDTTGTSTTLAPGASTTFTITAVPGGVYPVGTTATVEISNTATAVNNPYIIPLQN
jgi:alpha-tubulin suppressor-like RCC1 family protein